MPEMCASAEVDGVWRSSTNQHGELEEYTKVVALVAGSLAGLVQTPNRAAIEALLYALKSTRGDLTVMPDSEYLVGAAEKGEGFGDGTGVNADLWACVRIKIKKRRPGY